MFSFRTLKLMTSCLNVLAWSQPDLIGLDLSVQMFMAWSQPDLKGLNSSRLEYLTDCLMLTGSLKKRIKIWE